jgi:hypothetical protein
MKEINRLNRTKVSLGIPQQLQTYMRSVIQSSDVSMYSLISHYVIRYYTAGDEEEERLSVYAVSSTSRVLSQINTKHINTVWAESAVVEC